MYSLIITAASTVIATGIGIAAALLLRQRSIGRGLIGVLFQLNLTLPHLIGALGRLYLLGQPGLFARLTFGLN